MGIPAKKIQVKKLFFIFLYFFLATELLITAVMADNGINIIYIYDCHPKDCIINGEIDIWDATMYIYRADTRSRYSIYTTIYHEMGHWVWHREMTREQQDAYCSAIWAEYPDVYRWQIQEIYADMYACAAGYACVDRYNIGYHKI